MQKIVDSNALSEALSILQQDYQTDSYNMSGMTSSELTALKEFIAGSMDATTLSYSDRGMEYIFAPGADPRKVYWYNCAKAGHGVNVGSICPSNIYNEVIPPAASE